MCPPGHHVVRGHERSCVSGTRTWVDTHIRRNRGKAPKILLKENIHYLYWRSNHKYKRLGKVYGFKEYSELDAVIQFWLDYWKEQGFYFPDIDPLLIKVLIAVESSFNPKAKSTTSGSSATGLMQVTNQVRRILEGTPNADGYQELKSDYMRVSRSDIEDPIVAIATGIRWFAY